MPVSLIQGDSLLAVDIGAALTRAVFFDVVDGQYRFVAAGQAPSTAEAPFKDVSEGVREAIEQLQSVTGLTLLDEERGLITPSQPDGSGVDALVSTLSAGPALRAVIAGLLPEASLESARRLTETVYARIVDRISLHDRRRPDELIDSLLRQRVDVVVLTGGTDGGASRSIQKMVEPIGLASYLLPEDRRPAVLFAGNQKMEAEVRTLLGSLAASLHFSPNVRPSLETEDIEPAARELARLYVDVRRRQLKGVDTIEGWSNGHVLPTGYASGRMMRFLSRVYGTDKGILSANLGASAAVVAAAFKGRSTLGVYPQFGLGENLPGLLHYTTLEEILAWSPVECTAAQLRDYLYQRSLYPSSLPATLEDQALAQAVARQALRLAMKTARGDFPSNAVSLKRELLPLFEPIIAGGTALSDAPSAGQSLLLLLDAIQPVGIKAKVCQRRPDRGDECFLKLAAAVALGHWAHEDLRSAHVCLRLPAGSETCGRVPLERWPMVRLAADRVQVQPAPLPITITSHGAIVKDYGSLELSASGRSTRRRRDHVVALTSGTAPRDHVVAPPSAT